MKINVEKKELRAKSVAQLYKELASVRMKIADLRKDLAFGKLKSPQKLRDERKKIAFILTVIREKMISKLEENEKIRQE
jgi:ribosomal protein L29